MPIRAQSYRLGSAGWASGGRRLYWADRRFPPPWSIVENPESFVVTDATGQPLNYIYFEDESGRGQLRPAAHSAQAERATCTVVAGVLGSTDGPPLSRDRLRPQGQAFIRCRCRRALLVRRRDDGLGSASRQRRDLSARRQSFSGGHATRRLTRGNCPPRALVTLRGVRPIRLPALQFFARIYSVMTHASAPVRGDKSRRRFNGASGRL